MVAKVKPLKVQDEVKRIVPCVGKLYESEWMASLKIFTYERVIECTEEDQAYIWT